MKSFAEFYQECDTFIRNGRADLAGKKLLTLNTAEVPREERLRFANLCRRASLTSIGLRLLAPIIHPERNKWRTTATAHELSEYAMLLMKNGSIQEALITLNAVDEKVVPEKSMYRGFCHVFQWEYDEAILHLQEYLKSQPATYTAFVAKVNLSAAFVSAGRLEEALSLLDENIRTARDNQHSRLLGNCLELRSQAHLRKSQLVECRRDLEDAARIFGTEQSSDQLFVNKWQAVLEAIEKKSLEPLTAFREVALSRKHWESVRDTDFFMLKVRFDQKGFDHLLFGTPYSSYRERLVKELKQRPGSDSYLLGHADAPALDLLTGGLTSECALKPGQKVHQMLTVLLKDFYKPVRLGGIFAELFPEEKFDIFTSPNRVHQLLFRTRQWLTENEIPVAIDEIDGNYSVKLTGPFGFLVPLDREPSELNEVHWSRLKRMTERRKTFSAKEARESLGMSRSAFHRLTTWATAAGMLEKTGQGNAVRYKIATMAPNKKAA